MSANILGKNRINLKMGFLHETCIEHFNTYIIHMSVYTRHTP